MYLQNACKGQIMKSFFLGLALLCCFSALHSQINYFNWHQGKDFSLAGGANNKIDVFIFVPAVEADGGIKLSAESQKLITDLEKNAGSIDYGNFNVNVVRAVELKNNFASPNVPTGSSSFCKKMGLLEIGGFRLSTAFTFDPYFIIVDTSLFETNELMLTRKNADNNQVDLVPFKDCNGYKTVPFVECHGDKDLFSLIINQQYNFAYLLNELKILRRQVNQLKQDAAQNKYEMDSLIYKVGLAKKKF
jgi:hypothetical protein